MNNEPKETGVYKQNEGEMGQLTPLIKSIYSETFKYRNNTNHLKEVD